MPDILLRFLPHIAIVLAVLAGVAWIDHNAAARTRDQIESASIKIENKVRSDLRQSEQRLAGGIGGVDKTVRDQVGSIGAVHTTIIQPTLTKELSRETRFSDPNVGISDGVREQVNRSLATVSCTPRPDGGIVCTLPDSRPVAVQ